MIDENISIVMLDGRAATLHVWSRPATCAQFGLGTRSCVFVDEFDKYDSDHLELCQVFNQIAVPAFIQSTLHFELSLVTSKLDFCPLQKSLFVAKTKS